MKLAITNLDNQEVGSIELSETVFGLPVRKDLLALNTDALAFMKDKGMIVNTVADTSSFRKKLKDVGFYKEWKEKLGPDVWKALEDISGPLT